MWLEPLTLYLVEGKTRKLLDCQHGVNLLLYLQGVPLGDGAPGVSQHV